MNQGYQFKKQYTAHRGSDESTDKERKKRKEKEKEKEMAKSEEGGIEDVWP